MATRHPPVYSGRIGRVHDYFVCDTCQRACFGYAYWVGGPWSAPWRECIECWIVPRMPPMPPLKGVSK